MVALDFAGTSGRTRFMTSPSAELPEGVLPSAWDRNGGGAGDAFVESPRSSAFGRSIRMEEVRRTLWRGLTRLGPTTIAVRARPTAAAGTMYRRLANAAHGELSLRCS